MAEYISTWMNAMIGLRTTIDGELRRTWEVPTPCFFYLFDSFQLGADLYTEDDGPLNQGESGRSIFFRFWAARCARTCNGRCTTRTRVC